MEVLEFKSRRPDWSKKEQRNEFGCGAFPLLADPLYVQQAVRLMERTDP